MTKRQELIEAYGQWLKRYRWEVFGTLTFPGFPSRSKAQRQFDDWLHAIKVEVGTSRFRYVQVAERGAGGDNIHFHFLIGGLKKDAHQNILKWCNRWRQMAGVAVMGKFEPKRGAILDRKS